MGERMEARISGHTTLLGLIGSPVEHSLSPAMHNYASALLGLDYAYLAFDVPPEKVKDAISAMKTLNIRGYNVTMPDKVEVMKYMDELSPAAELMGAVNTIVNEDGYLTGHNTDGIGFVSNLKDHGVEVLGKKMVLCGAGGAATAIMTQCALDGVKELIVFNRKGDNFVKAQELAKKLMEKLPEFHMEICDIEDEALLGSYMAKADILVNSTSLGMAPKEDTTVVKDTSFFHKNLVVCDVVYNPLETRLLREAKAAGCKTVGGKGMLLWQGVAAFELFTGEKMPVEQVKEKYFSEA